MTLTRRSALQGIATLLTLSGLHPMKASAASPLRIGVIGAGSLGGTVGSVWVKAGHEVLFSTRHPEELASMIRELGPHARAGTAQQAAQFGSVVLFAVPYPALAALGRELQEDLRGKIVLDACNASASAPDALSREARANGAGVTSAKYLPGTRLVRAFSAVDATDVASSFERRSEKLGVPLASDDAEALKLAAQLVRDAGCDPVIVGNLAQGKSFERDGPGFRANTNAPHLRKLLGLER